MQNSNKVFSFAQRTVSLLIVEMGAVSLMAVVTLLIFIIWNGFGQRRFRFLRGPIGNFFLGLLVCDLIRALGRVTDIVWVVSGRVTPGGLCTAQAVLRHIGTVGEALFTLTIGISTFTVIYLRYNIAKTRYLSFGVIGIIALFLGLIGSIPAATHRDPPFYGPAELWCSINKTYMAEHIGLMYGILWMGALINICLYLPLCWYLWRDRGNKAKGTTSGQESADVASKMMVYPIAYIFLVLPMSIVRWIGFANPGVHVGLGWTALGAITFGSSGLVNSLLFIA
ncbi:hypothetical protein FRC02_006919, partial [Tulasnella sp. 418]